MENRRNFFKSIGLFIGGAIASKVNAMVPKKSEEKEELMAADHICVTDDSGNQYNVVVVPKKQEKPKQHASSSFDPQERIRITASGHAMIGVPKQPQFMVRKLNNQS